jgi:thiamine kinase-like enzyme
VVAHGDPNLANYLWDGTRVRIVDFEDAGRGDRTVELDGGPSEKRNAPRHCGSAG